MKNIKYFFVGIWDEFCKDLKYSVDCYVEQGKKKLQDADAEYMQKVDADHNKIQLHNHD